MWALKSGVQSNITQPKIFGTEISEFQLIIQWPTLLHNAKKLQTCGFT